MKVTNLLNSPLLNDSALLKKNLIDVMAGLVKTAPLTRHLKSEW